MSRRTSAFTLVEMIGVLTIISIVAAFTLPPIIRQIRQTQAVGEDEKLKQVSEAILGSIQATGNIPNPDVAADADNGWFTLAQNYTALSADAFRYVFPENPSTERRYYVDTAFANYLAALTTPYQTPPDGFPEDDFPLGAKKILLVSSSRPDLPLPGKSGENLPASDQMALSSWNKIFSDGVVQVPTLGAANAFSSAWLGLGEFLHIKSLDLSPFFCRVELFDTAAPVKAKLNPSGAGYGASPEPQTKNGTTVNFNQSGGIVYISSTFPAQRQNGLTDRDTTEKETKIIDLPDPAGTATELASLYFVVPGAPQFKINDFAAKTITDQKKVFFILKGSSLKLISSDGDELTQTIQKDSSFEYYGDSWRQLY